MVSICRVIFITHKYIKFSARIAKFVYTLSNIMKIVFATANQGKLREAAGILGEGYELVTPAMLGITEDIPETGTTLQENSAQKAEYLYSRCHTDCFADDTGLEVNALGGAPGVYSARYAGGEGHDSQANMDKLLHELEGKDDRTARFHTIVTLYHGAEILQFEGEVRGHIGTEKKGDGGFGYDPVFIPDMIPAEDGTIVPNTEGLTMAEVPAAKNVISHRAMALKAMAAYLHSKE